MHLDSIDWKILVALQEVARISFSELGRTVGLSAPAVTERVRKLEESQILAGYRARLNTAALGFEVIAFISATVPAERYARFLEVVRACPEVLECHHVSGAVSFILKVVMRKVQDIDPSFTKFPALG
jgi:Lrp/AsnC family transcriptional regulator, leucine-responsive regulatory protein